MIQAGKDELSKIRKSQAKAVGGTVGAAATLGGGGYLAARDKDKKRK